MCDVHLQATAVPGIVLHQGIGLLPSPRGPDRPPQLTLMVVAAAVPVPPSLTFPRFFSSLAQADKSITWSAASLSAGTDLSVEFRIDLCGYCDKYDGGRFNPIDSFQYE